MAGTQALEAPHAHWYAADYQSCAHYEDLLVDLLPARQSWCPACAVGYTWLVLFRWVVKKGKVLDDGPHSVAVRLHWDAAHWPACSRTAPELASVAWRYTPEATCPCHHTACALTFAWASLAFHTALVLEANQGEAWEAVCHPF